MALIIYAPGDGERPPGTGESVMVLADRGLHVVCVRRLRIMRRLSWLVLSRPTSVVPGRMCSEDTEGGVRTGQFTSDVRAIPRDHSGMPSVGALLWAPAVTAAESQPLGCRHTLQPSGCRHVSLCAEMVTAKRMDPRVRRGGTHAALAHIIEGAGRACQALD